MKKDPKIFLRHIIESIEYIEKYTRGKRENNLRENQELQDAVVRRIEIIGEAVKNLPADFKKKYPEIKWRKITGMRDMMVHEYFGVDLKIVWKTVKRDIPLLKKDAQKILKDLGGQKTIV